MTSSPDAKLIASFIKIDRQATTAIYMQVAQQLLNAISRGYLLIGSKMPGTRVLADLLEVHRKTIVASYYELEAQGWLSIEPNKGAFVMSINDAASPANPHQPLSSLVSYPAHAGFTFKQSNILDDPFESSACLYAFNDGNPDIRLTQIDHLSQQYAASMKRKSTRHKMAMYNHEGSEYFKEHLSKHLNLTRGMHIQKGNLMITRSTEMSLYIICRLLISPKDLVLVGSLSLFTVNMVFQKSKANIHTVPVDAEGLDIAYIRSQYQPGQIRLLYLMPNHQYPTTVYLSAQRRVELLALAKEYGFIIIEDDYDYDFQFDRVLAMPLASVDTAGMVIYLGSFGKSLAPAFRMGFVVGPENLMLEMRKYLGIIDRQGDVVMEHALGEMIEDGAIHRHLKKSLKVYKHRRDIFCALLRTELGEFVDFQVPSGGLAVWTRWPKDISLLKLAKMCEQDDLFIPKTLLYQNQHLCAIRLGFGHLNEQDMQVAIAILKANVTKLCAQRH